MGGIDGRTEATGLGLVYVTRAFLENEVSSARVPETLQACVRVLCACVHACINSLYDAGRVQPLRTQAWHQRQDGHRARLWQCRLQRRSILHRKGSVIRMYIGIVLYVCI